MLKIDGKKIAQSIIDQLKIQPRPKKALVVVLVGDDLASISFLRQKEKVAAELGVDFKLYQLSKDMSQADLETQVRRLSDDSRIGGIIIQLPLPRKINRDDILKNLDYKKDVDNLTGRAAVDSPATAVVKDILAFLSESEEFKKFKNFKDLKVAVVGAKGFLVGRPIVRWLGEESLKFPGLIIKEVDKKTKNLLSDRKADKDLKNALKDADLVITGVGKNGLISPEWLKEGSGVIDFGYPSDLVQLPVSSFQHLKFYTPTPGGTGPILVAELFKNFYKLNPSSF